MVVSFDRRIPVFRYMDTVGDGTGTKSATGIYATPTEFKVVPAAGEVFELHRMIISLSDTAGSLDSGSYGNGIVLTNGIKVEIRNASGTIFALTNDRPVITNAEWGHLCYDVNVLNFGTGDEHLVVRWTFTKGYGGPFIVDGDKGEYFAVILEDNFSGLTEHLFHIQGESRGWY